jgi:hypothetical protein
MSPSVPPAVFSDDDSSHGIEYSEGDLDYSESEDGRLTQTSRQLHTTTAREYWKYWYGTSPPEKIRGLEWKLERIKAIEEDTDNASGNSAVMDEGLKQDTDGTLNNDGKPHVDTASDPRLAEMSHILKSFQPGKNDFFSAIHLKIIIPRNPGS